MESADLLVLYRYRSWIIKLRTYGAIFSVIKFMIMNIFRRREASLVIAESAFNAFFRQRSKLRYYIQLTVFSSAGLWLSDGIVRWLFLCGLGVVILLWMRTEWQEMQESEFIQSLWLIGLSWMGWLLLALGAFVWWKAVGFLKYAYYKE